MNQIVLPVVLPLLAAFLMQPLARVCGPLARLLGPLVLMISAFITARIGIDFGDVPFSVAIGGFPPPLGIVLYADQVALLFALLVPLFTLLFWPGAAAGEDDSAAPRRGALVLLLVAAATGLALSGDLFNIYVFYELASVASFGLVALTGTPRAQLATLRYLFISALGSVLALAGIAILYLRAGTLNLAQLAELAPDTLADPVGLASFVLMLMGFGVKAELFPLNTWVPEVYATAPARVSALLAGLVSKLAVLVLVRLLVLVFHQPEAAELLLALGILGVLSGELAAWRARDFPRMIAFSSIGQLGIVFIAFSIGGDIGMLAGLAVALHHLIVKSALFGLAARWNGSQKGLAGAAKGAPLAAALFVLFSLSLIGVPPLLGFWTKLVVLVGLVQGGTALQMVAMVSILLATAVEASYLFRTAMRLYENVEPRIAAPRLGDGAAAALLGVLLIAVTLGISPVADHLRAVAQQANDVALYVDTVFPKTLVRRD